MSSVCLGFIFYDWLQGNNKKCYKNNMFWDRYPETLRNHQQHLRAVLHTMLSPQEGSTHAASQRKSPFQEQLATRNIMARSLSKL